MPLKRVRAWLLPALATIITIVVLGAALLPRLLDLDTYKADIVDQVKSALKRDLHYDSGAFALRLTPAFTFKGVTVKEKDGKSDFITADQLTVKIAILPLLRGELVLSRIQLEKPTLNLWRDRRGVFNIADLLTPSGGEAPGIRGVELKKGHIRFADYAFSDTPVVTELADTDLYLSRLVRGKPCDVKLAGNLLQGTGKASIFVAGVAKIPAAGQPWSAAEINGRVRTGPVDAGQLLPYYSRFVPFKGIGGFVEVEGQFKGKPTAFKSKGEVKVTRLNLDYPQVFRARLTPKSLQCAYQMELTDRDLVIDGIKLNLDGFKVNGSVRLSDVRSKDMRITAKATSNRFDLRAFRQYIPYGIIVDDTAKFIEEKVTGGIFRLDHALLDGRVSRILHMELGQNYNVLSVRAHVDEGVVDYGSGIPVFSGIKGDLELAGKDFLLKGMSGRFGTSPLTLDGKIADYPIDVPSRYPFTAVVQPKQPEVAWLLGKGLGSFTGNVNLNLKGEGTTSLYKLSGDGDLTRASYAFLDIVAKPAGRPNAVSFTTTFDKEQFRITGLTYRMAPVALAATAASRYSGPVSFDIRTNQFQSVEVGQMVPMFKQYHPAGLVQLQLHAAGPDIDRIVWSGNASLSGVSFKLSEKVKPITAVTGNVRIDDETIDSAQITARVGSTSFSGRGRLTGFKSPTAFSAVFTSPSVDPSDLGLLQTKVPVRIERVQGNLSYAKETLQIASLSGTLGRSALQIKGSVKELQHPVADLSVTSPHLDVDDLMPLFAGSGGEGGLTLKAHLNASEGKWKDLPFQRLHTNVLAENNVLQLHPFDFSAFEGDVTGSLKSDFTAPQPRHTLTCNVQKVSSDQLLRAMGVKKQEMTGAMSLQGELSVRGESAPDFKRTAHGNVKLKVERGTIRKFSTLSKILSILNVSQLFKLQLPDMVSGGMPFTKITGDFALKDGFASTQNFFLDSNAMNISAVGKMDMVRNELDLTIGVQPLQTVDKVVSKIPIIGWVLVGPDRSLISTYFEAKGKIEDPQVTAIPVKSLAKGVFNIFKRVFELPGRLITDTGEVIIGK